jgi:hypothetical protein
MEVAAGPDDRKFFLKRTSPGTLRLVQNLHRIVVLARDRALQELAPLDYL